MSLTGMLNSSRSVSMNLVVNSPVGVPSALQKFPWAGSNTIPWPICFRMANTHIGDIQTFFVLKNSGHERPLQSINISAPLSEQLSGQKPLDISQHELDSNLK